MRVASRPRPVNLGKPRSALRFGVLGLRLHALVPTPVRSREQPPMMQAFRNSAKVAGAIFALLMLVFVLTSVDWSGLSQSSAVGKINGQSVDSRTSHWPALNCEICCTAIRPRG